MMKMLLTWSAREKSVAAPSWPSSWQVLDREERNMWYLGDIKMEHDKRCSVSRGVKESRYQ